MHRWNSSAGTQRDSKSMAPTYHTPKHEWSTPSVRPTYISNANDSHTISAVVCPKASCRLRHTTLCSPDGASVSVCSEVGSYSGMTSEGLPSADTIQSRKCDRAQHRLLTGRLATGGPHDRRTSRSRLMIAAGNHTPLLPFHFRVQTSHAGQVMHTLRRAGGRCFGTRNVTDDHAAAFASRMPPCSA